MEAFTFLDRVAKAKPFPFYVLTGDEAFLKRQVTLALRTLVLGPDDDGFGLASHPGDKATWGDVLSDVRTLSMMSPRRLVVVENADGFVTRERAKLEKFVAELPADEAKGGRVLQPATAGKGVLVLDVTKWPSNTKLAKSTPDANTIDCTAISSQTLPRWCVTWCAAQYQKQLDARAAALLVDLIGNEMGLLDKEMDKLASYVGSAPKIDARDVDQLVGRSRTETVWELFNLIGAGKTGDALSFLRRLLDQGEAPLMLLGAFGARMRKTAQVARLHSQGIPLPEAMDRVGINKYPVARNSEEQFLRHLGRRRLDVLYDWLLETDAALKGRGTVLPPEVLLERLVVRLARQRT